jgi:hypothetical protein
VLTDELDFNKLLEDTVPGKKPLQIEDEDEGRKPGPEPPNGVAAVAIGYLLDFQASC